MKKASAAAVFSSLFPLDHNGFRTYLVHRRLHKEHILERIKLIEQKQQQDLGLKVPKDSSRPPYVSGAVWVEDVAEYIIELFPNLYEEGLLTEDVFPYLTGTYDEDTWN